MYSWRQSALLLGTLLLGVVLGRDHSIDRLQGDQAGPTVDYRGTIPENAEPGDPVKLNFPLLARDRARLEGDEICGYTLYKSDTELPFRIILEDKQTGRAKIVLEAGCKLDYERKKDYKFEVAAHDCVTSRHATREKVHIEVNEYAPRLSKDTYLVEVEEGHLFDEILRLDAKDDDGSKDFATICSYHILTPDAPFEITSQGILRNTEPLDFSHHHNFILEVKVQDCGQLTSRMSDKVIINVKVKEACKATWKGISDRIEYTPGSNQKLIGELATLETCDSTCKESMVSTRIQLTTKHIGKGCDRDTYSIQSQRKLCGAASGSVDLLPSPAISTLTKDLPTDDGNESDQIFYFDGSANAIEIPSSKFNHSLVSHFTISTWMRHEENPEDDSKKGQKEHIMCNSDGEKMERHHYALFIHNCRLVFLLRQEPYGKDQNIFKPAEWRWKIPQVCDGLWHHFAVSVDFPQVRLYVDGKLLPDNPEIIDDWPLHPTKDIHFTRLVVGACYQGRDHKLSQYFHGYLAGLTILRGKTESDRVIRCLNDCKEKLDFHAMNEMETGMSVAFNSEMTEITINGHNRSEVEKLVRRVGYINSRMYPTPGHRTLKVETDVTCMDGRKVKVADLNTMVIVLQTEKPIITITGLANLARDERDFVHGQKIFNNIRIVSRTQKEIEEEEDDEDKVKMMLGKDNGYKMNTLDDDNNKLDSCIIRGDPPLKLDVEHLKEPSNLIDQLGMEVSRPQEGLIITGIDTISNYEKVLREIHYIHRKPESINSKSFTLVCSELNERFVSNEFHVKVDVVHTVHEAHVPQQAHVLDDGQSIENNVVKTSVVSAQSGSISMVVIIVVCVGFLVFMIVLGIIRIRAAHQRTQVMAVDEKPEMEWDNSALTITVNPMDQEVDGLQTFQNLYEDEHELNALRGDDSDDSDDDISSYHDELESSEEESEKVKDRELEWDDSTLTF